MHISFIQTHVKPCGTTDKPRTEQYVSWKKISPMSRILINFGCMKMLKFTIGKESPNEKNLAH
jgi:hypothetical protein